ncbi:MAG: hypothetical protein E7L25_10030 [Varibaculum cambriense]|nr:hypothetical protein [Varibaculum cambriense]
MNTYLPGTTPHNGYTIRYTVQHDALHNPVRVWWCILDIARAAGYKGNSLQSQIPDNNRIEYASNGRNKLLYAPTNALARRIKYARLKHNKTERLNTAAWIKQHERELLAGPVPTTYQPRPAAATALAASANTVPGIDNLLTPTRKDINTNLADQARYVTSHVHTLCEGIIANPAADENTIKHALDLERLARYLERLARYLEWKTETLTKEGTEQC